MTIKECIKSLYDEEMDKVFGVSGNYLMTIARRGYEKEHAFHSERAEVLKRLMEQAQRCGE